MLHHMIQTRRHRSIIISVSRRLRRPRSWRANSSRPRSPKTGLRRRHARFHCMSGFRRRRPRLRSRKALLVMLLVVLLVMLLIMFLVMLILLLLLVPGLVVAAIGVSITRTKRKEERDYQICSDTSHSEFVLIMNTKSITHGRASDNPEVRINPEIRILKHRLLLF